MLNKALRELHEFFVSSISLRIAENFLKINANKTSEEMKIDDTTAKIVRQRIVLLDNYNVSKRQISTWLTGRGQQVMENGKASTEVGFAGYVPQGTVLRSWDRLCPINDLDLGVEDEFSEFAGDIKIGFSVRWETDRVRAKWDWRPLDEWRMK